VSTIEREQRLQALQGGLIASCQPVPGGALDTDEMVVAMAKACEQGGAVAVRIEGVRRVAKVAASLRIPVVGIVKRDLEDSAVRITPWAQDVSDLVAAGAAMVAVDGTQRQRPVPVAQLLAIIQQGGCLAMADCATFEDGLAAHGLGFDCVGTTLSGYTEETLCASDAQPDEALVRRLSAEGVWVVAEGRIKTAQQAAQALAWGAQSVTVGSALTRLEWMVADYVGALQRQTGSRAP
jgi:N-acylglucosamine-6-phosphate 2-epimerase